MELIICGAGNRGKEVYSFLKFFLNDMDLGNVIGFIDSDSSISDIDGISVYQPEKLMESKNDIFYIITPYKEEIIEFYKNKLQNKKYIVYDKLENLADLFQIDLTTMQREICAYWHIQNMDYYFDNAESDIMLSRFWGEDSVFKKLFDLLDLTNVVELACGRGRHVNQYINYSNHITIVDILQKNIDYCKKRFGNNIKISYYKNNGYNLEDLPTDSFTALFCYDAMVHFEMLDIYSYLVDIFRIMKKGGKVLLHHSNLDTFCEGSYTHETLHGRAFMNYKIFAYLAIHAGFKVVKQEIVWWENISNLDCVTLLEKK